MCHRCFRYRYFGSVIKPGVAGAMIAKCIELNEVCGSQLSTTASSVLFSLTLISNLAFIPQSFLQLSKCCMIIEDMGFSRRQLIITSFASSSTASRCTKVTTVYHNTFHFNCHVIYWNETDIRFACSENHHKSCRLVDFKPYQCRSYLLWRLFNSKFLESKMMFDQLVVDRLYPPNTVSYDLLSRASFCIGTTAMCSKVFFPIIILLRRNLFQSLIALRGACSSLLKLWFVSLHRHYYFNPVLTHTCRQKKKITTVDYLILLLLF